MNKEKVYGQTVFRFLPDISYLLLKACETVLLKALTALLEALIPLLNPLRLLLEALTVVAEPLRLVTELLRAEFYKMSF